MRYLNDWIWLRLSNRYNVTSATHSLGDVYNRWVNETVGDLGVDLVDFYRQRIPDAESLNDAEYAFWAGGPLHDAVLWLDAQSVTSGHSMVPNLGSGGSVLDAQRGNGTSFIPALLEHAGENYLYCPGVSSNNASSPDAAVLDITGDIDIRVRVALNDWTPSIQSYFIAKRTGATERSWIFGINANGTLALFHSADGVNETVPASTVGTSFVDGQTGWIRATLDVDNGAGGRVVTFYTAADALVEPTVWTQLGSPVTTAGTTSIFSSTAPVTIGSYGDGGTLEGKMYRAIVRNGIGGTVVFDADFTKLVNGSQTTFTEDSVNAATVTINRSATGLKSVVVTRPVWLFGTNRYLQVADNDLLDFGATDSFTVMAVARFWGTINNNSIIGKGTGNIGATMQGYQMFFSGGAPSYRLGDGTTRVGGLAAAAPTSGEMRVLTFHRDVASDRAWAETHNVESGGRTTDTTTGTLASGEALFVGGTAAVGYTDAEVFAVAVWRRTLSSAEIDQVIQYYGLTSAPSWAHLVLDENDVPILDESGDVIETE